jgi:hypothetical protein
VVFDQNTPTGEWRRQVRCCEDQNVALHRDISFALAVGDLLELPDDLPLLPAVTAAMSIPIWPSALAPIVADGVGHGRRCCIGLQSIAVRAM